MGAPPPRENEVRSVSIRIGLSAGQNKFWGQSAKTGAPPPSVFEVRFVSKRRRLLSAAPRMRGPVSAGLRVRGSAAGRAERFRGRKRRLLLFRGGAGARALSQQRLVRLRRLGKTL